MSSLYCTKSSLCTGGRNPFTCMALDCSGFLVKCVFFFLQTKLMRDPKLWSSFPLPECEVYIFDWRQDLVSVTGVIVLGWLLLGGGKLVLVEHGKDVPFHVEGGKLLSWAQRTERHHRMFDLSIILEKFRSNEAIIFEFLQK